MDRKTSAVSCWGIAFFGAILLASSVMPGCGDTCRDLGNKGYYRFERGDRCPFVLTNGRIDIAPSTIVLRPNPDASDEGVDGQDTDDTTDAMPSDDAEVAPGTTQDVRIRATVGKGEGGQPADGYEVWVELRQCNGDPRATPESRCRTATSVDSAPFPRAPEQTVTLRSVDDGTCSVLTRTSARCILDPDGIAVVGVQAGSQQTEGTEYCLCAESGGNSFGVPISVLYGFEDGETVVFRPSGFDTDCGGAQDEPCVVEPPRLGNAVCAPTFLRSCEGPSRRLSGTVQVEDEQGVVRAQGLNIGVSVTIQGAPGVGFESARYGCESSAIPSSDLTIISSRGIQSSPMNVCLPQAYEGDLTFTALVTGSSDGLGPQSRLAQTYLNVRPTIAGVYLEPTTAGGTDYEVTVVSCAGEGIPNTHVLVRVPGGDVAEGETDESGTFRFSSEETELDVVVEEAGASCPF